MATKSKTTTKQATATKPRVAAVPTKIVNAPSEFINTGTEVVKDFLSAGSQEAKRAQEKVLSFSREHVEKWASGADQTARSLNEGFAISKEGVDALVEYSKIAGDLSKEYQQEVTAELNEAYAETVATAKELLACRTVKDYVELQTRVFQTSVARAFDQSARLTDLWFKLTTEAAEPLNSQVNRSTQRLNKVLVSKA